MRTSSVLFTAALASLAQHLVTLAAADRTPFSSVKSTLGQGATANTVPNAYIVELAAPVAGLKRGLGELSVHEDLYKRLAERNVAYSVRKEFSSDIFTGVSITLASSHPNAIDAVSSIPGIKSFQPVTLWNRPAPLNKQILSPSGPKSTDPAAAKVSDTESTHRQTGVDKLHALGYFGKGVTIGIIDTGVDYTHPALGGGFGKGFKVALGYDFVGDAYTGFNTPVPDNDPLDQCEGHGSHVAGIIGANPTNPFNISGVAYEATLAAYRVFGCAGQVSDDVLIDALTRAYHDGVDILTLSLGGAAGWTEQITAVVASRIADQGKIVTIAAGNDGAEGAWYTSGPGTGLDVISVASVENSISSLQTIITSTGYGPITYNNLQPYTLPAPFVQGAFYPIYALSTDTSVAADGCDPLPASTPDLTGKIVLVRRGSCTFVQKLQNIAAKGGNFSLIYDNLVESVFTPSVAPYNGVLISAADGAYLVSQFAAGANVLVKIPETGGSVQLADPQAGLVNSFSTWGPTNDLFYKPAVAAPGGNIVSTYPVPLGSYAILSGTSMATPFVAGSAALLFQKNGKSKATAKSARTLFETTSVPIPVDLTGNNTIALQSLVQAGSGLINVFNALTVQTTLTPGELLLNDTAHYDQLHVLTITNHGKKIQKYQFAHVPAGTASTISSDGIQPETTPPQSTDYASVSIVPSHVTLLPGFSAEVIVSISPPKTGSKATFPVFSGTIQATGSLGENVHASYLGLNAKASDLVVIDNTDWYFGNIVLPSVLDASGNPAPSGQTFTLQGSDVPTLLFRLAAGSAAVYVDLVSANTTFTPTDTAAKRGAENGVFERSWWWPGGGFGYKTPGTFAKVPTVGPLAVYEYQVRNTADTFENNGYLQPTFGAFANGTAIPKGSYKVLLRALHITADPKSETSYDSWLSTAFSVV